LFDPRDTTDPVHRDQFQVFNPGPTFHTQSTVKIPTFIRILVMLRRNNGGAFSDARARPPRTQASAGWLERAPVRRDIDQDEQSCAKSPVCETRRRKWRGAT
jgi:hypothetical protein